MTTVPPNQAFNTHYGKIKNNNTEHLIQHVVQQNNVTLFNFSISAVDVTGGLLSVTCDTVTGDLVIYSLDLEDDRAELSTDIYNYAVGGTVEIFLSVVWNLYLMVAEVDYDDIPAGEVDDEAYALLQARIKKLEKDLKDAQDDLATAQGQLGTCQENNTTLTGQLSTCQESNSTLTSQLNTANNTITQLTADLAAAQSSSSGESSADFMGVDLGLLEYGQVIQSGSLKNAITITQNKVTTAQFILAHTYPCLTAKTSSQLSDLKTLLTNSISISSLKIDGTSLDPTHLGLSVTNITDNKITLQITANSIVCSPLNIIPSGTSIPVEVKLYNTETTTTLTYNDTWDTTQRQWNIGGGGLLTDIRTETSITITTKLYSPAQDGTLAVKAQLNANGSGLAGKPLQITIDDRPPRIQNTNSGSDKGYILYHQSDLGLTSGTHTITLEYTGDEDYQPSTATTTITVE